MINNGHDSETEPIYRCKLFHYNNHDETSFSLNSDCILPTHNIVILKVYVIPPYLNFHYIFVGIFLKQNLLDLKFDRGNEKNRGFLLIPNEENRGFLPISKSTFPIGI